MIELKLNSKRIKVTNNQQENPMNKMFFLILFFVIISITGCMEIETKIIMQQDGSAVIKETIRFHKELLDFTDESGKAIVVQFIEKPACEERTKSFGKGTVLVSHSIKNLNGGVRALEAEYKIPDINDLYVINPYLCFTNYKEMGDAKFTLTPLYKSNPYGGGNAGEMCLNITTEKPGVGQKVVGAGQPLIKPPSPSILQKYRNLQPIFKDSMKEFKVLVSFQCYAPLYTGFGYRDRSSKPRSCEIFSFSGADYDNTGGLLLDNDEIMQELLRQKFWDINFVRTAQAFPNNATVPVMTDAGSPYAGWRGTSGVGIFFRPTKAMFQKYFEGKKLDYNQWGSDGKNAVPAEFDKIGFDPAKDTMKSAQQEEKVTVPKPEEPAK
jgi:hypothetical protein